MVTQYNYRACNVCVSRRGGDTYDLGPAIDGVTLDGRRAFLNNGNAVLICNRCGTTFTLRLDVRCQKKSCNKPAYRLIKPKYYNKYEPHGYCEEHWPKWLKAGGIKAFLYGKLLGAPAEDYKANDVSDKCGQCGTVIICSNKVDLISCQKCGTTHIKKSNKLIPLSQKTWLEKLFDQ